MPDVVHGVAMASWASGLFDLVLPRAKRQQGFVIRHNRSAPMPQWLADVVTLAPSASSSVIMRALTAVQPRNGRAARAAIIRRRPL